MSDVSIPRHWVVPEDYVIEIAKRVASGEITRDHAQQLIDDRAEPPR